MATRNGARYNPTDSDTNQPDTDQPTTAPTSSTSVVSQAATNQPPKISGPRDRQYQPIRSVSRRTRPEIADLVQTLHGLPHRQRSLLRIRPTQISHPPCQSPNRRLPNMHRTLPTRHHLRPDSHCPRAAPLPAILLIFHQTRVQSANSAYR